MSFLKDRGYQVQSAHNIINYIPEKFSFETIKPNDMIGRLELRFNKYK